MLTASLRRNFVNKDVVIIGAGIVGCAIARELSKYDLKIAVVEKENDVASGISEANSGIIHAGFNEKKGTLKDGQSINSTMVINAAGINSDEINNMIGENKYTLKPVKGEYILLDKIAGKLINKTIFQVPRKISKGVLVTPTADGNLLVGPTAKGVHSKEALENTKDSLNYILEKSNKSVKSLPVGRVLTTFAGLRPHLDYSDFIIEATGDNENFISLVGIDITEVVKDSMDSPVVGFKEV